MYINLLQPEINICLIILRHLKDDEFDVLASTNSQFTSILGQRTQVIHMGRCKGRTIKCACKNKTCKSSSYIL